MESDFAFVESENQEPFSRQDTGLVSCIAELRQHSFSIAITHLATKLRSRLLVILGCAS